MITKLVDRRLVSESSLQNTTKNYSERRAFKSINITIQFVEEMTQLIEHSPTE